MKFFLREAQENSGARRRFGLCGKVKALRAGSAPSCLRALVVQAFFAGLAFAPPRRSMHGPSVRIGAVMNLHRLLQQRAAAGKPVRVGVIGAGKFGTMFLSQSLRATGMHLVGVAARAPQRAREALLWVGAA